MVVDENRQIYYTNEQYTTGAFGMVERSERELAQIEADTIVSKIKTMGHMLKHLNIRLHELQKEYDLNLSSL